MLGHIKKLHINFTSHTKSAAAQAKNIANGELCWGISLVFRFDDENFGDFPVASSARCEVTDYGLGSIVFVLGVRNTAEEKSVATGS